MSEQSFKKVFIFLDTDLHSSPFDILTTIDVFPDAKILKYENVTLEQSEKIIYDIIFPRGPEGVKHTKIFLNGSDFKLVNDILNKIISCMFPPFELAVLIDPRGAYTTAAAAVAKTLEFSINRGFGGLDDKNVVLLAGTGPVGETVAKLYALEKANVVITSRSVQRSLYLANKINQEVGFERVVGVEAQSDIEVGKAIESADIILSAGAAGIQILPFDMLKRYGKKCSIVVDLNAIPPLGIENLKSDCDCAQLFSNIYGFGALTIGKFKNKIEVELLKKVADESKGIFGYNIAYDIAKKIIFGKLSIAEKLLLGEY